MSFTYETVSLLTEAEAFEEYYLPCFVVEGIIYFVHDRTFSNFLSVNCRKSSLGCDKVVKMMSDQEYLPPKLLRMARAGPVTGTPGIKHLGSSTFYIIFKQNTNLINWFIEIWLTSNGKHFYSTLIRSTSPQKYLLMDLAVTFRSKVRCNYCVFPWNRNSASEKEPFFHHVSTPDYYMLLSRLRKGQFENVVGKSRNGCKASFVEDELRVPPSKHCLIKAIVYRQDCHNVTLRKKISIDKRDRSSTQTVENIDFDSLGAAS